MPARRFPPPWSVEELDACFVVRDECELLAIIPAPRRKRRPLRSAYGRVSQGKRGRRLRLWLAFPSSVGSGIRLPASRRRSRTAPGRPIAISAPKNPDFWRQGSVQTEVRPGEIELRYRPYIYYGVYLFTVIAIISVLTEYISLRINRSHGERIPFLFNITPPVDPFFFNITSPVSLLDPNLGYAHGDTIETPKVMF